MNTVNRDSPLGLFYDRQKTVTGGLGQSSQNGSFIAVINAQERTAPASKSYGNWHRNINSRLITGDYTTAAIHIPIVSRHTDITCLRHAVSSLGACPTPAL